MHACVPAPTGLYPTLQTCLKHAHTVPANMHASHACTRALIHANQPNNQTTNQPNDTAPQAVRNLDNPDEVLALYDTIMDNFADFASVSGPMRRVLLSARRVSVGATPAYRLTRECGRTSDGQQGAANTASVCAQYSIGSPSRWITYTDVTASRSRLPPCFHQPGAPASPALRPFLLSRCRAPELTRSVSSWTAASG